MEMDLKRLHHVLTVARTGSISVAAQELHLTQPALSRSIATLEDRYGIRLFERGRGGARPTELGKMVIDEARGLLRQARAVDHNLRLYGSGEAGRLAFGMGPLPASLVLPALAGHFLAARPALQLESVTKGAQVLYQELLEDEIEILFCGEGQLDNRADIRGEPVGAIDIAAIVRTSHPLAGKATISAGDMAGFPLLSGVETRLMQDAGGGAFICDNYHILREVALSSDAVWVSSPQLVADDVRAGRLAALPMHDTGIPARVRVCMFHREAARLSPAALAVRDFVRDYLGAIPGRG
ncbi:LysR family transcriptional regulator [Mangrovimicrobium sediminis]|uniref:LysR family transcriptional regulator n=1 Tax=Mangrovimicrobium sediminis TaxID=2562682 RepID=A0A4Z0LXN5_9GAMM|nr:LysR family transcriptional regulator [Haliea sp. SAOS-164]TGD71907.1 LysR family transcriptional regulator [Haliea sp. SAOS-164]